MVMPSLLSQFVPSVSSRANTDFMRCWAVAFAEEDRKVANCGASVTGALGGVGTGGGVCIEKVLVKAGGLADSVGAIGEAGTVDSNGLTGAPEECGEVGAT